MMLHPVVVVTAACVSLVQARAELKVTERVQASAAPTSTVKLPVRTHDAVPAAGSLEGIPFDVTAVFRVRVAPDGSTHDIEPLAVRPTDEAVRDPVPAAIAARTTNLGLDALRRWRYADSSGTTFLRVTFNFHREVSSGKPQPRKVIGVEACLPPEDLTTPPIVAFSAKLGRSQQLEHVSIVGGNKNLHEAALTLIDQWRFDGATDGTGISSMVRFFALDCIAIGR